MFMKLNQEFDFKQYLVDNTEGYNGKYSEYIFLSYLIVCLIING